MFEFGQAVPEICLVELAVLNISSVHGHKLGSSSDDVDSGTHVPTVVLNLI